MLKRIKVLHICTILLTAKTFISPVISYLQKKNYEVAVTCSIEHSVDGPMKEADMKSISCPIYGVGMVRTIQLLKDIQAVWQVYRLIRCWKPDIVHTQTSKAGMVGRIAAQIAGVPIIVHTAHAFPFHEFLFSIHRKFYIFLERFAGKFTDLIMVDTYAVREEGLNARITKKQDKIVVVPMGISLEKFSPSLRENGNLRIQLGIQDKELVVGTVARLVPDKGIECFLRMAAYIANKHKDVGFLVVGDGSLREELESLAKKLGLGKRVVFAGHRTDIPSVMQLMDVFVLPTLREGFGVVFAEAMAMEKATIGSRIGPVAEVIEEGVTGYLAAPNDHEEFATYALDLLGNELKRIQFGKAGRKRVERLFSEQIMCETIENHYCRLLAAKGLAG